VLIPFLGKLTALKRCTSNLIDNALKFGHSATQFMEDSNECCIILIQDQGSGIPNEQIINVFIPYNRLEISSNRDTGGLEAELVLPRKR
jgi:K+-sensing histidine kinase KdpD